MKFSLLPRLRRFRRSLRARVALGVALPVLLAMASLAMAVYFRERQLLEDQLKVSITQLGQALTGSLRHAMLADDRALMAEILRDVAAMQSIRRVQILDARGVIRVDSQPGHIGQQEATGEPGCSECHAYPSEVRPRAVDLSRASGMLRIASPIENEPACAACHPADVRHLGILLADVPIQALEQPLLEDLGQNLAASAGMTVLITAGVYGLVHWSVVRRVERFGRPLAALSRGEFSARLPEPGQPSDELGDLARAFNAMARDLEQSAREQQERNEVRYRAVIEERARIARELHDGLAQLLGYVNTKAMAVRLMVTNGNLPAAEEHLMQLEEAARALFVDVREVILGLKLTRPDGEGNFLPTLSELAQQFERLSGLTIQLRLGSGLDDLKLPPEAEIQLVRIAQEALTNARKHSRAGSVQLEVQRTDGLLEMAVRDDGLGFDLSGIESRRGASFGLEAMRERAQAVGATLELESRPGGGTAVVVRLPDERG